MFKIAIFSFLILFSGMFLTIPARAECPVGDLNGDCCVDSHDMQVFAEQWLLPPESPADFDGDDVVNMNDYSLLAENWGKSGFPLVINELMASNNSIILG